MSQSGDRHLHYLAGIILEFGGIDTTENEDMSEDKSGRMAVGHSLIGVVFGMMMSGIVSDALASQPGWIRITATAISAGVLAGGFILIVNRLRRS